MENYFNCDKSYSVNYDNLISLDKVEFANFKIMSWDIEADSEYGDFPKAIKDYKKQGAEIADFYLDKINNKKEVLIIDFEIILRIMFDLPINGLEFDVNKYNINKIYFKKKLKDCLNHKNNYIKYLLNLSNKIYTICIENKQFTTYKNNSIFDNWIKKDKPLVHNTNNLDVDDYSDDCLSDNEENDNILNELKTNRDIIIYKINKLFTDKIGLHVRGDRLTQIGVVFYNYGTTHSYDRYIITLGSCDSYNEDCVIIKTKKEETNKFLNPKKVIENSLKEETNKIKIIPYYKNEVYDNYDNKSLDKSEKQVILTFKQLILQQNPDIIVAYNNFGFDNPYLIDRCKELDILSIKCSNRQCHNIGINYFPNSKDKLYCNTCSRIGMKTIKLKETFNISRLLNDCTTLDIKVLSSSALGDNILHLINSKGIVHIDLLAVIKRDHNLESYKLDFIAEKFLNEHKDDVSVKQIFEYQKKDGCHRAIIAKYCVQDCVLLLNLIKKLDICASNMGMANVSTIPLSFIFLRGQGIKIQSLFGNFCMKENVLLKTLEKTFSDESYEGAVVLEPVIGMYLKDDENIPVLDYASLYPCSMIGANISHDSIVDIEDTDYKSLSEIKNLKFTNMRDGFKFLNIDKFITDKSLIENIINLNKVYPLYDSIWIPEIKKRYIRFENVYKLYDQKRDNPKNNDNLNIPDYNYTIIYFYTYRGKGDKKYCTGIRKVTFANPLDPEKIGIVPKILKKVLKKRKDVRKLIPNEPDIFKKGVYEGLQLAYKQSANSLYGQTGSPVSCISDINLASATTATGRLMLDLCKTFSEQYYKSKVVYGDTDSIFCCYDKSVFISKKNNDNNLLELLNEHLDKPINFENNDKLTNELKYLIENMNKVEGKMSLKISILRSIVLSNEIAKLLRPPHDLEYEKTFAPFILFSKKRYVGTVYELEPGKGKLKYMGIVLKRRDNAKIVKDIYGGIINKIIEDRSVESSIKFLQDKLIELTEGKVPIEDLTVTKTLRGHYKKRAMIAHAVLADKIADRTGEKVASNTRIAYVYIEVPEKKGVKLLQGNRIDTPEYITEHNLKIDYKFYITNQLSKPILQIYDLEMKNPNSVFTDILRKCENKKSNNMEITKWFKPNSEIITPIIIKKGCIYQIKTGKICKKKCNKDVIENYNYCLKHNKIINSNKY